MSSPEHEHTKQPKPIGFPGWPGYPALPAASKLCYAIADGCAQHTELALDEAAGDLHVTAALVAYTAEVLSCAHRGILPPGLGTVPTYPPPVPIPDQAADAKSVAQRSRPAPVPSAEFTKAATAAYNAAPASCSGLGVPAARRSLQSLTPDQRVQVLSDVVRQLAVYQPRTVRGGDALTTFAPHT